MKWDRKEWKKKRKEQNKDKINGRNGKTVS
jgi:hypothetical protein